MDFRYCKFGGDCKFSHDILENINSTKEIEEIINKLEDLGIKIKEKGAEIALKDAEIKSTEKLLKDIITILEDKFEKIAEKIEEFKNVNESLRKTIQEIKLGKDKDIEKIGSPGQDDDCEEVEENSDKKKDWSEDAIEDEETVFKVTGNKANNENHCKICDFIGKTEAALKIHVTAKHKEKEKVSLFRMYRKVGQ